MKYIGLLYCTFPPENAPGHVMNEALANAVETSPLTAFIGEIAKVK
ncbi:hypothetical protein [Thalassotalea euphylliae]|nr:hypothetical protein [Thalassotalea euphylliae]